MNHSVAQPLDVIICDIYDRFEEIIITESWRPSRHKNDLHGLITLRALDLRSWIYDDPQKVVDYVNNRWIYDPTRPEMMCCVYHDSGQGDHFHIQVHPYTVNR